MAHKQKKGPAAQPAKKSATPRKSSAVVPSLGDLLATLPVPLKLENQRALAAALPGLRADDPQLVKRIQAIPGLAGHAIEVARILRLGELTGYHLPLVRLLQRKLQIAKETEGSLRPLAALRPDEWLDLAYTHGTPDGQAITPAAYADALAATIGRQYPTDGPRHRNLKPAKDIIPSGEN